MYGKSVFRRVVSIRSVRYYQKSNTKKLLEFLAGMPKANSARIAEAQRQRQHIAKKADKYGPSTVYMQVLGSGARGGPNTLYLFTDQKRYLFNCGECTQRLAHEHKVKLSRLDHIFITNKTWRNIGGLPGLSLTLQDVGVPNITLHGPEGLDELYNATKRFVIMKDMTVAMAKCSPSEDFEDGVMNVKYVLLGPHDDLLVKDIKPTAKKPKISDPLEKDFEEFIHDDTDYYKVDNRHTETRTTEMKKYVKDRVKPRSPDKLSDPIKKKTEKVLQDLQRKSHCSVAYICTLKKRMGTLDLTKCVELGVKPGPLLGQLKSGQDVVLPDGTLVLSKDVKTPDDPGPVFIVIDVPELSYLKEAEFSAHYDDGVNPPENIPTLIVHYTPMHVFHEPAYRAFMMLFGPMTRHLVLNGQNSCLGSEAVHRTQHKLHLLDPDIFPLLRDVSVPAVWNAHPPLPKTNSPIRLKGLEELKNKIALAQFQNIINMEGACKGDCRQNGAGVADEPEEERLELIAARTLTIFHLRPKKQLDRSAEPKLHIQDYIQETMDVDGFVPSLEQFRRLVDSMRYAKSGSQKEYPKVVFLGTGSCIPSKTRNTSAIVLHVDEDRSILLDCGEGTFGQLTRFYGPKRVNAFLRTLKAIYVSHLHADHHIGLIGVLQARRQAHEELRPDMLPEPVYLLAPGQIVSWLSIYDQQFERIRSDFTLIPNQSLLFEGARQCSEMTAAVLASVGVGNIQTCFVSHCPNAFAVSIDIDGHKITYSGDTIPCEALVRLGENSTLLIHEATMEDELAEEARVKMHSTTTQAIEVGKQMNARYTVLTHFSQRYARLPRLNPNILNDNNSVGIAFDNMQITMNDLELLPHMYAPLQLMFAEHCVEMELRAAHRARQRERRLSTPSLTAETGVDTRNRRLSPGCRGAVSLTAPRSPARYRESTASRLRQEMKGMTICGGLGAPQRSHSVSPGKSPRRRSSSQSPLSGHDTPKLRSGSQETYLDVIAAPRTLSDTSNVDSYNSKEADHKPSASVVDTRSRTLSSASRIGDEEIEIINGRKVIPVVVAAPVVNVQHAAEPVGNGYGKPLLTPLNKRLTLNRESRVKQPFGPVTEMPPSIRVNKSPMAAKAENRRYNSPSSGNKRNINSALLPVKCSVSGSKCGSITSNVKSLKSPMSRSPARARDPGHDNSYTKIKSVKQSSIVTSKLKSASPPSAGTKSKPTTPSSSGVRRELRGWSADSSHSSIRSAIPRPCSKKALLNETSKSETKYMHRRVSPSKSESKDSHRKDSPSKSEFKCTHRKDSLGRTEFKDAHRKDSPELVKKSLPSLREALNEQLKKQQAKDIKPISVIGRPNSANHSNRSFKPQLEDIKSSFLLLNKKTHDDKPDYSLLPVTKPKPLDENERRERLLEIKKKFQSRGFFHDSKYDKIEGLNWISWK